MKNIKIGAKVQFFFVYLPSKKMKYYLCIAFWLSLLFVGCAPKDKNTPEAVAKDFIIAVNKNEFAKAKHYGDSTVVHRMTQIEQMFKEYKGEIPENPSIDFQVIQVVPTDEHSAIITYSLREGESYKQLKVRKIAGQWKVTLEMQEAMPEEKP